MAEIAIAWNGLPFYGARLIRAGIERLDESMYVIGSKPSIPIEGMEETLGQTIHWIDNETSQSWSALGLPVPKLFIHTGWRYRGFNTLAHEVRRDGGRVVSMIDNQWKNSVRQWLGALVFRLRYRRWFDAVWVPGKSARRLCRFLGMPDEKIHDHVYGIDPDIFDVGPPLDHREKRMLFVGQLIARKRVRMLVEAFRRFRSEHQEWTLRIAGEGEITIPSGEPGIQELGFLQPEAVAEEMRDSRFFVLPSREDHWPLVVCEAALSGCGLILSSAVGNAPEFLTSENGVLNEAESIQALSAAMCTAADKSQEWLQEASSKSRRLGEEYNPQRWAETLEEIVRTFG